MRAFNLLPLALAALFAGCTRGDMTTSAESDSVAPAGSLMAARDRLEVPEIISVRLAGGRATVTWRPVTDATGYQLVSCDAGSLPTIDKPSGVDTVHLYTGLTPGVSYGVKLRARKATGLSKGEANNSLFSPCRTFVGAEAVASILLSPATAQLMVGESRQMTATLLDRNGAVLTDRDLEWATSNPLVATVSPSGLVAATGAGAATITVTSEGVTASATFNVLEPVASITISPSAAQLDVGQAQQFTATPRDRFGVALSGRAITWTSSATVVATVSSTGLVQAVAAGSATITATSEGVTALASVSVVDLVASMDLIWEEVLEPTLNIGTMKGDGSQRRVIAPGVHPTWVGNTVLARGPYQNNQIFRMNPDGTNRRLIVGSGPSYIPDLSPDGLKFVFDNGDCGGNQHWIATANVDGTGLRRLGLCGDYPRWSPVGDRLAFVSGGALYTSDVNGGAVQLVVAGLNAYASSWSPDGSKLVFDSRLSKPWRTFIVNADGSNLRQLFPGSTTNDVLPDWSPSGDWIAFASDRSGKYEHWRVRADGSQLTRMTSTALPQTIIRWRR